MLILRAELSCPDAFGGTIDHGHIDIQVSGVPSEEANQTLWPYISRDCALASEDGCGTAELSIFTLDEKNDRSDLDTTSAIIVAGEGEALAQNPIGTQFF